jgi:hypothetical protein
MLAGSRGDVKMEQISGERSRIIGLEDSRMIPAIPGLWKWKTSDDSLRRMDCHEGLGIGLQHAALEALGF